MLASAYSSQVGAVSAQSDKAAQFEQLRREVDLYQGTLNSMLQQVNQAAVVSALPTGNIRIVDPAVTPGLPYKPDAMSYELYGVAAGSASGVFLVLVIATISNLRSSRTFGVPGYSPRVLKVPELGVIPSIAADQRVEEGLPGTKWGRLLPGRGRAPAASLIGPGSQGSFLAESFQLTLTSILLMSHRGRQPKIIVVTSPGPGEGKTTVVSNLAIAIAESGRKVLVVDADLRRPRIHTVFGIEKNEGFAEFMVRAKANGSGIAEPVPAVCQTRIDGVFVLPSGLAGDLNLSNIFHSPVIQVLLDKLTEEFDVILIDTPPMIQFSDARLMARLSDGVILVVRSGVTERESAVVAGAQLVQDNIEVLGTILNDWDARSAGKYQYRQYHSYASSHLRNQKTAASGERS
jgi:capsular exopolysaccharide synthesis family protein